MTSSDSNTWFLNICNVAFYGLPVTSSFVRFICTAYSLSQVSPSRPIETADFINIAKKHPSVVTVAPSHTLRCCRRFYANVCTLPCYCAQGRRRPPLGRCAVLLLRPPLYLLCVSPLYVAAVCRRCVSPRVAAVCSHVLLLCDFASRIDRHRVLSPYFFCTPPLAPLLLYTASPKQDSRA